jgi:hypothetical protein
MLLLLSLLLCVGCNTFDLAEKWLPLTQMVERPHIDGKSGITTTVGTKIYRENIAGFLEKNPPGSLRFDTLLYHEQVHSKRQLKMGLMTWLVKYGSDTEFMWMEERLGYYAGFMNMRRRGGYIDAVWKAKSMAKYVGPTGPMVTYEDALKWIQDALSGRWKPDEADMWSMPDFLK